MIADSTANIKCLNVHLFISLKRKEGGASVAQLDKHPRVLGVNPESGSFPSPSDAPQFPLLVRSLANK